MADYTPTPLSHLDAQGRARMVDVGGKAVTAREAVAEGFVTMRASTLRAIAAGDLPKGEVLAVARVAGIGAAKRTGDLIPLCHPLPLDGASVDFEPPVADDVPGDAEVSLRVEATARVTGRTGVEMEALAAVTVAALTVYDMCKAADKGMSITGVRLLRKTGGRSAAEVGGVAGPGGG